MPISSSLSPSSSYFFTSPNFTINHHSSSSSLLSSTSVSYRKPKSPPISANFTTTTSTSSNSVRSPSFSTHSSLYEVLGIQIGADTVEIKAAYRRLARVVHPDVGDVDSSADEFIQLHSAYATLSDPCKRADYDRSLFVRQRIAGRSFSPAGFPGYGGRRWETDQCW